jgi:hypothetical protein
MHTYKSLHFGATTTQRFEGNHASIKRLLEGKMNTEEVLDRVDKMFRRKVCFLVSTYLSFYNH